jgi:HEAT repeat protein
MPSHGEERDKLRQVAGDDAALSAAARQKALFPPERGATDDAGDARDLDLDLSRGDGDEPLGSEEPALSIDAADSGDPAALTEPNALTDQILGLTDDEPESLPEGNLTPEIAQVRRLARSLAKAVKVVRLYPLENPLSVRFADDLVSVVSETFRLMDVVRLSVGKAKLFFGGEPVLDQPDREDSVPARLFWDGIREITFHVGLTRREVIDFLRLFRVSALRAEEGEDDIVTMLWDGDFEHITHIAIDDILDLENAEDPVPEEFGHEFMNYVDLEMHNLEDEETERAGNELAEEIRAKINDEEDPILFGVSEEERRQLRNEMAEEGSPKLLGDIVHIIYETLLMEKDEQDFVSLVQVLSSAMLGLIGEGRLREAAEIVRMLRELRGGVEAISPAQRTVIESALKASWDRTRCQALAHHLDAARPNAIAALAPFVQALPMEAVRALCEVLGELETRRARRLLVDALIVKANGDIAHFLPFLKDTRWYLVRNVAHILGATRNERAVEPLKNLLNHPDSRVRKEALTALSRVGKGKALLVLEQALYDDDPRIRVGAARNLALVGRRAFPALLTVIEEKDFEGRDLSEKRAFYEALGLTGGKDVLPLMEETLSRRALLFRKTQTDEMRACACEALGWIGGPEAERLLGRHLEDRSVLVRTAAQSGLRRAAGERHAEDIVKEAA